MVKGVNTACEFVKALADPSLADPYKAVKDGYVMEDGNFCVTLGTEGFAGEVVLNVIVGADMNTVQGIEILSSNETAVWALKLPSLSLPISLRVSPLLWSWARTLTPLAARPSPPRRGERGQPSGRLCNAKSAEFGTTAPL